MGALLPVVTSYPPAYVTSPSLSGAGESQQHMIAQMVTYLDTNHASCLHQ